LEIQEALAVAATRLAYGINADAILTLTEAGDTYELILRKNFSKSIIRRATGLERRGLKLVAATPNHETYEKLRANPCGKVVKLVTRDHSRIGQIRHAVWRCLKDGILWPGELVVCLAGDAGLTECADTIFIYRIKEQELKVAEIVETEPVMAAIIDIAAELGRGAWHGQPVGTAFIVGDSKAVLRRSRQLVPNPFKGHRGIFVTNKKDKEIIKRFAYLDGAFIVADDGQVITAGRYLDANGEVDIPLGLGTRHRAVAAMTAVTSAKGVTVSGEDGMTRIFKEGKVVAKIDSKSKTLIETSIGQR
jgi:DNA integrity scanning protein DisA with diadenylate cyclase activity